MSASTDDSGHSGVVVELRRLHREATYSRWLGRWVAASAVVFFATAFAGFSVVDAIPLEHLEPLVPHESILPEFSVVAIAVNNLRVLGLLAVGLVTVGVVGALVLAVNGLVVGAVVALAVQRTSWLVVVASLLPHGVLELPAFWMAAAAGFRFTYRLGRWALGYEESPLTRVEAFELVVLFSVLALTIAVAAWVEVVLTPEFVDLVAGGVS
ncbi:MAG: stage II sporulation protein M [Haloarculaceae archaeon]